MLVAAKSAKLNGACLDSTLRTSRSQCWARFLQFGCVGRRCRKLNVRAVWPFPAIQWLLRIKHLMEGKRQTLPFAPRINGRMCQVARIVLSEVPLAGAST